MGQGFCDGEKAVKILTDYAMSFLGVPYLWAGKSRLTGIDCSGFVEEILKSGGADVQGVQNAQAFFDLFKSNPCKRQAGALAFYGTDVGHITHVALLLDAYRIIESAGGDHTTTNLDEAKRKSAMVRIRPLIHRPDLQAVLWPGYPFIPKET